MPEVKVERCAGIDVHKKFVMVCILIGLAHQKPASEVRRFGTNVPELERLRAWLLEKGCTDVVMESTGSYWKPVFNILERDFKLILANAEKVKALRGKKTDPNDSRWLAGLLRAWTGPAELHSAKRYTGIARSDSPASHADATGSLRTESCTEDFGRCQRENRQCVIRRVRHVWTSDAGGFTRQRHDR